MRCQVVIAFACTALATFEYPDTVPLEKRQAPGTPQYECHANCGGVIQLGRTEGYCENPEFLDRLDACLNCANDFGIWQYYGNSVTEAATECGLDATPLPADGDDGDDGDDGEASSSAPPDASSTPPTEPSSTPAPIEESSTAPEPTEGASTETSAPVPTGPAEDDDDDNDDDGATTTPSITNGPTATDPSSTLAVPTTSVPPYDDNAANANGVKYGLAMLPLGLALMV